MSKTREEQQLVLEGTAYDNFINAVRSKSSQKFYLVGLKKFMAYNHIQKVSDMLAWDQRLIEAKIISSRNRPITAILRSENESIGFDTSVKRYANWRCA